MNRSIFGFLVIGLIIAFFLLLLTSTQSYVPFSFGSKVYSSYEPMEGLEEEERFGPMEGLEEEERENFGLMEGLEEEEERFGPMEGLEEEERENFGLMEGLEEEEERFGPMEGLEDEERENFGLMEGLEEEEERFGPMEGLRDDEEEPFGPMEGLKDDDEDTFKPIMSYSQSINYGPFRDSEIIDKFSQVTANGVDGVNGCISSGLSNAGGYICLTPELVNLLKTRGGNASGK